MRFPELCHRDFLLCVRETCNRVLIESPKKHKTRHVSLINTGKHVMSCFLEDSIKILSCFLAYSYAVFP